MMLPPPVLIVFHFLWKISGLKFLWNFIGNMTSGEPDWDSNTEKYVGGTIAEDYPSRHVLFFVCGAGGFYMFLFIGLVALFTDAFSDKEEKQIQKLDSPTTQEFIDALQGKKLRELEEKYKMPKGIISGGIDNNETKEDK